MKKENENKQPAQEKPARPVKVDAPPLVYVTESYDPPIKENTNREKRK